MPWDSCRGVIAWMPGTLAAKGAVVAVPAPDAKSTLAVQARPHGDGFNTDYCARYCALTCCR